MDYTERKKRVKLALDMSDEERKYGELKATICPFFKGGDYSTCIKCTVENFDVDECTEYFLDRVDYVKIDIWSPKFDLPLAKARDKKKLEEVENIGMTCDSCYMSEKCPEYEKHAACAIDFGDIPTTDTEKLRMVIDAQTVRVKRASTFELIDGGVPDTNLSVEMDRLTGMIAMKDNLGREKLSVSIEASGGAAKAGGSILEKLFGGGATVAPAPANKVVDIAHEEIVRPIREIEEAKVEFMPDNIVDKYDPEKRGKKAPPPPRKAKVEK